MAQVYSTAQAAKLTGISEGTVRNYVRAPMYAGHFSAGANPPAGAPRQLSAGDLALLAFIREKTAAGVTHDQIAAQIAAGDMAGFTWQAPETPQEEAPSWEQPQRAAGEAPQPAPLALMASALTQELAQLRDREQALWDRLIASETARARAEGELAALKAAQGRGFFRRLFWG
jgi:DNA-binding transcriptional MerR regulator